MDNSFTLFISEYGYFAVFALMTLEGFCIPVFAELVLGFAGFLIFQGHLELIPTIISASCGSLLGSNLIYWLMRRGGRQLLFRWGKYLRITPSFIDRLSRYFDDYGMWIIVPWRLLPVVRTKISIIAGLLDMPYRHFLPLTALGITLWCTIGTTAGYHLGDNWQELILFFKTFSYYVIAACTLAIIIFLIWYFRQKRR